MSETALKDLNTIPGTERKSEGSGKACLAKAPVDNATENIEECQKKENGSSLVSSHVNGNQALPADSSHVNGRMSETALKDLNTIPGTERKSEGSGKACLAKAPVDNATENIEECQKKENGSSLVSSHVNGNQALPADSSHVNGRMSETALKDLNTIPGTERKSEGSGKACLAKAPVDNATENIEECQKKENGSSLVSSHVNGNQALPADSSHVNGNQALPADSVVETGIVEVEYIESENLNDLEDIDTCLETLFAGLDSKDWVLVCDTLNNVRRLSIFHKEAMLDILGDVITHIAKALKSPRSAVIKTAIMASADIFSAYNDLIIDSLDPLLVQLLLKSSQDKRFVCEAAEKALISMTTWISPISLLPKLQPYLKHKHPRIRAKASMCFSRSVPQLGAEGIKTYGIDKLIQIAASQLSDQLPESREAARALLLELQNVYEKFPDLMLAATVSENPETDTATESWENFCQSKLSTLSAQAVLRVTSIAREGLVS